MRISTNENSRTWEMGSKCSPNKRVLSAKTGSPAVEPQTSGKRQAQRCGETCRAAPRGLQDCRQKHCVTPKIPEASAAQQTGIRRKPSSASPGSPHVSRPRRLIPKAPITRVSTNQVWEEKKKTTPNLSRSFPPPTSLQTPPLYKRLGTRGNRPIRIPTAT